MTGETFNLLGLPIELLQRLDVAWTFLLLLTRFGAMFMLLPGLGPVSRGGTITMASTFVLALVCTPGSPLALPPANWGLLFAQVIAEIMLGFILGLIPQLVIVGVQTGAQIASTTMGLGVGNLIDPTSGQTTSDLSRILGDLMVILFLMLGGHRVIIYAASGLGGQIVPGTYFVTAQSLDLFIDQTAGVFEVGLLMAAPILVALMLTNFVMGLISKAVPSVNVFMVSFPLTIGIGLMLTLIALPDITVFVERQFGTVENQILAVTEDATKISP